MRGAQAIGVSKCSISPSLLFRRYEREEKKEGREESERRNK
jgi:hypothetical protein